MIFLRRTFDLIVSSIALVLLAPLFAVTAVLIKLDSRGPVFFSQKRIGKNGKYFSFYKFRTMRVDLVGIPLTAANDSRVTKVGRYLRKLKIDELPQLINVFCGDMGFVGPRPEVPDFVDFNDELWQQVLKIKPGITHPVTLHLRNEEHVLGQIVGDRQKYYREVLMPAKLNGYLRYEFHRSVVSDAKVMARTGVSMFREMQPVRPENVLEALEV